MPIRALPPSISGKNNGIENIMMAITRKQSDNNFISERPSNRDIINFN